MIINVSFARLIYIWTDVFQELTQVKRREDDSELRKISNQSQVLIKSKIDTVKEPLDKKNQRLKQMGSTGAYPKVSWLRETLKSGKG